MLLDNLVHELNALRGALGEPDVGKYAELSPKVVNLSLTFDGVDCHLSWVDLPGIARYQQELAFYGLDARATLTLPSPYLRGEPSELATEGGHSDSCTRGARSRRCPTSRRSNASCSNFAARSTRGVQRAPAARTGSTTSHCATRSLAST